MYHCHLSGVGSMVSRGQLHIGFFSAAHLISFVVVSVQSRRAGGSELNFVFRVPGHFRDLRCTFSRKLEIFLMFLKYRSCYFSPFALWCCSSLLHYKYELPNAFIYLKLHPPMLILLATPLNQQLCLASLSSFSVNLVLGPQRLTG